MKRRRRKRAPESDAESVTALASNSDSFILDWLDHWIGRSEHRRAILIYATPFVHDPSNPGIELEPLIFDFIEDAKTIAQSHQAKFVRVDMHGVIVGWTHIDSASCTDVISAAFDIANWSKSGMQASCLIATDVLLVSDYEAPLSDREITLVGSLLALASKVKASGLPHSVAATSSFLELADDYDALHGIRAHQPATEQQQPILQILEKETDDGVNPLYDNQRSVGLFKLNSANLQAISAEAKLHKLGRLRRLVSAIAVLGLSFWQAYCLRTPRTCNQC